MFNDERIIIERGKILRKINVIALVVSFIFLISRVIIYLFSLSFNVVFLFNTELLTLFSSLIILLIGEKKYKNKLNDERITLEKYNYYNKSGIVLLIFVLIGYCISMIASDLRINMDFKTNYIIHTYEVLGILCFYYYFKKNDININYSFIENDNKTYYKHVWKNILKLFIFLIVTYLICGGISVVVYNNVKSFIKFFIAGNVSIIYLGGMYLLLSYFEKIDYDNNDNKLIKKPFIIIALLFFILSIISEVIQFGYNLLIYHHLNSTVYDILQVLQEYTYSLSYYINILFILLFSFLLSYLKKTKKIKIVISLIFIVFLSSYMHTILGQTMRAALINGSIINSLKVVTISEILMIYSYIGIFISVLDLPLIILLTIFLIKDYKYPKYILIFSIAIPAIHFINSFLINKNQILTIISFILQLIIVLLTYLMHRTIYVKQPKINNNELFTEKVLNN